MHLILALAIISTYRSVHCKQTEGFFPNNTQTEEELNSFKNIFSYSFPVKHA